MGVTYTCLLILMYYSRQVSPTIVWAAPMNFSRSAFPSGLSDSTLKLSSNWWAVSIRASCGHCKNQSIADMLKTEGNLTKRSLNFSPTGENAITRCRLSLTLLMVMAHFSAGFSSPNYLASGSLSTSPAAVSLSAFSSIPPISPVFKNEFTYSRKSSDLISASVIRNVTFLTSALAASIQTCFMSSKKSLLPYVLVRVIWKHYRCLPI